MNLLKKQHAITIKAKSYILTVYPKKHRILLSVPGKRFSYNLPLLAACNKPGKIDFTKKQSRFKISVKNRSIDISFNEESSLWKKKRHLLSANEHTLLYEVTVKGKGAVDTFYMFRGFRDNQEFGSAPGFDRIFTVAPNFHEKIYFHPSDTVRINAGLSPFAGGQCLASPYYFYGLNDSKEDVWAGVGPVAKPGHNLFDTFEMNPPHTIEQTPWAPDNMLGGGFSYAYNGHLSIKDSYTFPGLLFTFGKSEWDTLDKHVKYQKKQGLVPDIRTRKVPASVLEPIFCGWHEQGACIDFGTFRDDQIGKSINDLCTQERHEHWLHTLEKQNCKPGAMIIDARWQLDTGNNIADSQKFPDMRAFIDDRHKKDQLVYLWTDLWTSEGVPVAECIMKDGKKLVGDPTNHSFEKRVRTWVRRMFSAEEGCYNADGVKLDAMLSLPEGKRIKTKGGLYGLELQKKYLSIVYDEAKKHKAYPVISVYSAHPYLADLISMVRIGDMYTVKASCQDTMLHRANIYKTLLPGVPIDTDGQFAHNLVENWRDIFEVQAQIGIPTLYVAQHVKRQRFFMPMTTHKLTKDDYRFFSDVLKRYRRGLKKLK